MSVLESELQQVTTTLAAARSRLSVARLSKNLALVQALEAEVAAAESRRAALQVNGAASVADITELTAETDPEPHDEPDPVSETVEGVAAAENAHQYDAAEAEPSPASQGVDVMPDEIVPIDPIERAARQLGERRAEMLARHAEELKALEADQKEIDAMAQAMSAFVRKFNIGSTASPVVRLDEERDMRLQSHG